MEQTQWKDYQSVFTNAKAGMDGVDKERVQRIVYEMSKGSAHFENEQRKAKAVEERITAMQAKAAQLTPALVAAHERTAHACMATLEASRDLTRTYLCVDMDAFYAAVEERDNPSLRSKPMGVGGMGMLSTSNYVARRFGVRSAMPGFIARRLCPELVFVEPDFAKYTQAAEATREVFARYDAQFQACSLDEALLDVTEHCRARQMTGEQVAAELRDAVRQCTQLTCSVGVAPNGMLAKVCSEINKPDGQYVLPNDRGAVMSFVSTLPVRKIGGIGRVAERVLASFGITTCGQLVVRDAQHGWLSVANNPRSPPQRLRTQKNCGTIGALFSPITLDFYLHVGLGIQAAHHGEERTVRRKSARSISKERTFQATGSWPQLEAICSKLAHALAEEMHANSLKAKTLTLKLKQSDFQIRTRATTLSKYIFSAEDIAAAALKLLKAELPITLRLMGIRLSNFQGEQAIDPQQITLSQCFKHEHDQGLSAEPADASANDSSLLSDDDVHETDGARPQGKLSLLTEPEGESRGWQPDDSDGDPFAGTDRKEQEWLLREIEFRNRRERDGKRGATRPRPNGQPTIKGFLKREHKETVE